MQKKRPTPAKRRNPAPHGAKTPDTVPKVTEIFRKGLTKKQRQAKFNAWLLSDPAAGAGLMDALRKMLREKGGTVSAAKRKELVEATKLFGHQVADMVLAHFYNPMAERFRSMLEQVEASDEDWEELQAMEKKISELLDVALDLNEPRRTKAMKTLTTTRDAMRKVLKYLEKERNGE